MADPETNRSRPGRWHYMSRPGFNPANDLCPECTAPSKSYYIGGKTVTDSDSSIKVQHRWKCEYGHPWLVMET